MRTDDDKSSGQVPAAAGAPALAQDDKSSGQVPAAAGAPALAQPAPRRRTPLAERLGLAVLLGGLLLATSGLWRREKGNGEATAGDAKPASGKPQRKPAGAVR